MFAECSFDRYVLVGSRKAKPRSERRTARKVPFNVGFELLARAIIVTRPTRAPADTPNRVDSETRVIRPNFPLRSRARTARFGFITSRERERARPGALRQLIRAAYLLPSPSLLYLQGKTFAGR